MNDDYDFSLKYRCFEAFLESEEEVDYNGDGYNKVVMALIENKICHVKEPPKKPWQNEDVSFGNNQARELE